ncbi:UPF0716 protein FxsA [Kineosphaera limosa]|uniref:FxsA family protein n=1 Tax=Kineosphaera limosa NBRC 100340 TaxID=1184609 RepID=K6WVX5_9MICO|nr:FxsA family protein [Kineosphaera limosa]NYE03234.1 UPF0716 protein FxsA [Kineosphaera limosa]GAB96242.1 hypothetical protein KILIM_033_00620 [Kineosphaera limosa NBRC 100340]
MRPGKGRTVALRTLAVIAVVAILEGLTIWGVARLIGPGPTIAILLVESLIGVWLVRREGARAGRALRTALQTGRMPSGELLDTALVFVGGFLLLTPGFITDIVGFMFVLPQTRPIARRWLQAAVERRLLARAGVVRSDVVDTEGASDTDSGSGGPPREPGGRRQLES